MQTIVEQLQLQKSRLLAACERKVQATEMMEEAEGEIRESRMSIATLNFALQELQKASPAAAPDIPQEPAVAPVPAIADPAPSESPPA